MPAGLAATLALSMALGCASPLNAASQAADADTPAQTPAQSGQRGPAAETTREPEEKRGGRPSPAQSRQTDRALLDKANLSPEDRLCADCHVGEGASFAGEEHLAGVHQGTSCATCHDDAQKLDKLHEDVQATDRMPRRLKKTAVTASACVLCHENKSDDFIELATNGLLEDADGRTVNPHTVTSQPQHAEITCVDCHEVHDDDTPAAKAQKLCASCHHAGVFECHTCHEHD